MQTEATIERLDSVIGQAGGIIAFAKEMDVSHQAVYAWKRRGSVPIERAVTIEALYGVPARELVSPSIATALDRAAAAAAVL